MRAAGGIRQWRGEVRGDRSLAEKAAEGAYWNNGVQRRGAREGGWVGKRKPAGKSNMVKRGFVERFGEPMKAMNDGLAKSRRNGGAQWLRNTASVTCVLVILRSFCLASIKFDGRWKHLHS